MIVDSRKKKTLEILFLIFVTLLLYSRVIQFDFVWDDKVLILKNPLLQQSINFYKLFTGSFWGFSLREGEQVGYYRPIVSIFYILEYWLWGPVAGWFHAANLALHLFSLVLLYKIAEKLGFDSKIRILACLLFTLHPVQSSTISFVSCHGDLLAQLFSLLCLWFWTFSSRLRWLALLWMFLAMLSKEAAVMLPLVLVSFGWIIQKKPLRNFQIWIPLLVWIPYFILRSVALDHFSIFHSINQLLETSGSYRTLVFVGRILFPIPISPQFYISYPSVCWTILFHFIFLVGVAFLFYKNFKNEKIKFISIWLFLTLLPIADWPNLGFRLSDQLLYISMVPASLLIAWYMTGKRRWFGFFLILPLFAYLSIREATVWKNDVNLWRNITSFDANNLNSQYLYAVALKNGGFKQLGCQKMNDFLQRQEINEDKHFHQDVLYSLGSCLFYEQPDLAEKYFKEAISLVKGNWGIRRNLIVLLVMQKKNKEAYEQAKILSQERPELFISWKLLATTLQLNGNLAESLSALQKAQALKPEDLEVNADVMELQAKLK